MTLSYGYNKGHQITSVAATDAAFLSYPAAINSVSYTAGVMNQYTAVGGGSPSYDGRGNLTADGISTFAYDHFNRLTTALWGGGGRLLSLHRA